MRTMTALFLMLSLMLTAQIASSEEKKPAQIKQALGKLLNPSALESLELAKSPVPGLYEAVINGHILYVTEDGNYLISGGEIVDINQDGKNLTEERRNGIRLNALQKINSDETVSFKPKGETKHVLTAFTDVDCFYCAKLHQEVDKLNEAGIEMRYLAFPRAGMRSETYQTMVSVWCADDQQKAMTDAKAGKDIANKTCSNPIAKQYDLGRQMGVSGTPALVMPNGELLPGYAPAEKLVQYLDNLDK